MHPYSFVSAQDDDHATAAAQDNSAHYIAGGTTLVDLMRLDVMRPTALIDVTHLTLGQIEVGAERVRIGALVRNSDLAHHPVIRERFPVLSEALLSGASPQIRNMATLGGNVLQRTRCSYFRDVASACNKRSPGTGCSAISGYSRMHAILGGSDRCIAVNPSDMNVALVALDAVVRAKDAAGTTREIPITDFHMLPADHPEIESALKPGELITHVDIPVTPMGARSRYVKVRDRASYAFALASAAVALDLENGKVKDSRIALGGVGTKPWRSREAEAELLGKAISTDLFARAAAAALRGAQARKDNAFKIDLARRTIVRALQLCGEIA